MRHTAALLMALVLLALGSANALARPRSPPEGCQPGFLGLCWGPSSPQPARTHRRDRLRAVAPRGQVVAHPAGCPRRSFCGCGASVYVFGHSVRRLWLAANWLRFPAAAPAPGMAAASFEHVFVLLQHVRDAVWLVYDANSGGHRTRIHNRSIAGYHIVNPRT